MYILSLSSYVHVALLPSRHFFKVFCTRKETWSKRTHAADGLFRYHTWPSPVHFSSSFSCVAFIFIFLSIEKIEFFYFNSNLAPIFGGFKNLIWNILKFERLKRAIKRCIDILNPPKIHFVWNSQAWVCVGRQLNAVRDWWAVLNIFAGRDYRWWRVSLKCYRRVYRAIPGHSLYISSCCVLTSGIKYIYSARGGRWYLYHARARRPSVRSR